jgi:hypothetical protein
MCFQVMRLSLFFTFYYSRKSNYFFFNMFRRDRMEGIALQIYYSLHKVIKQDIKTGQDIFA